MRTHPFGAAKLTTASDRMREPALNWGQLIRTLLLFIAFALAVALASRESRAAEGGAADRDFGAFVQTLWPAAHKRGVSRATFERAFADVTPDPAVLAKTRHQAEFVRPIADYLASAISTGRIETGQSRARDWKATLEKADARFGVDPYIVLGVWGLETNFGTRTGDLSTIRCLATLAYAGYRGDYFRKELIEALAILQEGHVAPEAMLGSWAGAMGQTQFMPSAFKRYAIDFDGQGRKDIWHNVPDALGSTAYFLKKHGWRAGEAWGFEVMAPGQPAGDGKVMRPFSTWAKAGFKRADGAPMPRTGEAALFAPGGPYGPHFLVTRNFKVIKSYNNSTAYALGVALLSERIAGGGPLRAAWPAVR